MKATLSTILLLFAASVAVGQTDTMRCGNAMVKEGDHLLEVVKRCGEPAYAESSSIYRAGQTRPLIEQYRHWRHSSPAQREIINPRRSIVEIPVTVYVYNFGRYKFMREVTFRGGRVYSIERLEFGY